MTANDAGRNTKWEDDATIRDRLDTVRAIAEATDALRNSAIAAGLPSLADLLNMTHVEALWLEAMMTNPVAPGESSPPRPRRTGPRRPDGGADGAGS